jgi:radical SAM superfamily enzyme YgiQ (UPF0313 family)
MAIAQKLLIPSPTATLKKQLLTKRLRAETAPLYKRLVVVLIHPSKYDSDGYPLRFWRAVMPTNSIAVMNGLVRDALRRFEFAFLDKEVHCFSDAVTEHYDAMCELESRFPEPGTKLLVLLVGVQTNQFPRSWSLASRWRKRGAKVLIGGFHVSGLLSTLYDGIASQDPKRADIPCPHILHSDLRRLWRRNVTVCHGEAEMALSQILVDCLAERERLLYRGGTPRLEGAPLPQYRESYVRYFADGGKTTTIDAGRGCPFACSFCSIINVQGRAMRGRSVEDVVSYVREHATRHAPGATVFITDDNFARHKHWREIFDGLIRLREDKGLAFTFGIEADLASDNLKDAAGTHFLEKAARAGCSWIFMGFESLNAEDLRDVSKFQNNVAKYAAICEEARRVGIFIHAGVIIGLPHDTPESVARDAERLHELGVSIASFFMLTPLPGSEDHVRAFVAGVPMASDWNKYDTFEPAWSGNHTMSAEEWRDAYRLAWKTFYSVRNAARSVERLLGAADRAQRYNLLATLLWYWWGVNVERVHPMLSGVFRRRDRSDMRPGSLVPSNAAFALSEAHRALCYLLGIVGAIVVSTRVIVESGIAAHVAADEYDKLMRELITLRDWFRYTSRRWLPNTLGSRFGRSWLRAYWARYSALWRRDWRRPWRLVLPESLCWHALALSQALAEAICFCRGLALVAVMASRRE